MINILIDTNLLIYAFDRKIDLNRAFDDSLTPSYKLFCIDRNLEELRRLGRGDVIKLLIHLNIPTLKTNEPQQTVDDLLVKLARERRFYIATQDRRLAQKARNAGIKIIAKGNKNKFAVIV